MDKSENVDNHAQEPWRLDVIIMLLYQLTLFFATQMLFVIFLEYMPRTYCTESNYCFNMRSKCLTDYDPSLPNLCPSNDTNWVECVENKKKVDFYSAQFEYQQDCNGLQMFSATTAQFIGSLIGNIILGVLSDKVGRRPVYLAAIYIGVPSIALSALIPGIVPFYVFRFLTGFAITGALTVGWTYNSELISPKRRLRLRTFANWANARMLMVLVSYIAGEWRWSIYLIVIISATLFPLLHYLPESPVFLEQRKKVDKAVASRQKLAAIAKVRYVEKPVEDVKKLKTVTIATLFKTPRLRKNFLILSWMWFYVGLATYITDLNGGDMSGNFYFGQFFSGLMLSVIKIIIGLVEPSLPWLGRRMLFIISQAVAIVCYILILIAIYFDNKSTAWYTFVYMSAYAFQSLCFETCYLSLAELIPTDLRTTAGAFTNVLTRIGTIIASVSKPLKFIYEPSLFIFNLIVCSIGIIAVYCFLEESKNVQLETVGQDDVPETKSQKEMESGVSQRSDSRSQVEIHPSEISTRETLSQSEMEKSQTEKSTK